MDYVRPRYYHLIKQEIFIRWMVSYVGGLFNLYRIFIFYFQFMYYTIKNIRKDDLKINLTDVQMKDLKSVKQLHVLRGFIQFLNLHWLKKYNDPSGRDWKNTMTFREVDEKVKPKSLDMMEVLERSILLGHPLKEILVNYPKRKLYWDPIRSYRD